MVTFCFFKELERNEYGIVFYSLFKNFLVPLIPTRNELATPKVLAPKELVG